MVITVISMVVEDTKCDDGRPSTERDVRTEIKTPFFLTFLLTVLCLPLAYISLALI